MTKKLVWRLANRPTVHDLREAVESKLLTPEEAKSMLVSEEDKIPKDSLNEIKEELKFLREMVLELAKKEPMTIYKEIYRYIDRYQPTYEPYWMKPYTILCSNTAKSVGDTVTFNALSSRNS